MSSNCKLLVLGSTGMLGNALRRHFERSQQYNAYFSRRNDVTGKSDFVFDVDSFLQSPRRYSLNRFDYVINCIGAIRQKSFSRDDFKRLNATFPIALANECVRSGVRLIHVSTDCVFSGNASNYTELSEPDPVDLYGWTKVLGEPSNCLTIRTSLIGDELRGSNGLLGWARSQSGKHIDGYTNHIWNGLTTDFFAKCCDKIVSDGLHSNGIRHVFNPTPVSKAQMLDAFNAKFNLNITVNHIQNEVSVNRTLSSLHSLCEQLNVPSFQTMLDEMESVK